MQRPASQRLLDLCAAHRAQIIEHWDGAVRKIEAFADTPASETRENVSRCLDAFVDRLEGQGEATLEAFVAGLAARRFATGFHLHAPVAAAARFRSAVIAVAGAGAMAADPALVAEIDTLLDAFNRGFSAAFAGQIVDAREKRLRELFALAPELFCRVDRTGALLDANSSFERFFSVGRPEWKGARLAAMDPKLAALGEIIAPVFASGEAVEGSLRLQDSDGSVHHFEARAHASNVDGESSAVVMLRDVTAERALRAQAIQAEKLASIGQITASVAHELNNPLTWVVSNLELALEELGEGSRITGSELRRSVHEALVGARRMAGIVRDLRTFAHNDRDEATHYGLAETIELALKIAGPQVHRNVDIERAIDVPGPLRGFPGRISQIVVNLVVNAGQALEETGRRGHMRLVGTCADELVTLDVLDDGPGIPPEVEERLFEPFVSSKGTAGTGLGLWISRSIVEGLGGSLEHGRVEGWTRFRVRFPRDLATVPGAPTARDRAAPARGTVLVIDDEPSLVQVLERRLDRSGVSVLTATGATQALTVLEEHKGQVAAVLCDLCMPGMDGLQLAAELRRRWPGLAARILFMSGAPDALGRLDEDQRCFEKPVRFEAVLSTLRELGC